MELHILLIAITICPIFIFVIKPLFKKQKLQKNHPPGPKALPILGNLLQLGPKPHESFSEMAKIYGSVFSLKLGSITTIISSSPDTAREILQTHDQTFPTHPVPDSMASQPQLEGTLAWVPGNHRWQNRRRIVKAQMLTSQKLDFLSHFRHRKVEQLIEHIGKHCELGSPVDIGCLAFATTLNLISNTIFSVDIVDPEFEKAQEFKELIWRIMETAGKPNLSDYFPILKRFDLQGIRRHVLVTYHRMHEIFDGIIEKRLKEREVDKLKRYDDLLDVLLDECELQDNNCGFSLLTIKPLILDLFVAGSDTSGITVEWAMAELVRNPLLMKKAQQELDQVIGKGKQIEESDLDKLPYLSAIVKETLRLHPAAPLLLPYIAENDVEVGGYTIQKGNHVMVNNWSIGRNPKYWTDPLSFSPERFLGSNIDYKGRDFEFLPFGAGRRICIGLPLANRMVNLMLASIIRSFNWELPKGISPENLDMSEQFGITLKKAVPLCAVPCFRDY